MYLLRGVLAYFALLAGLSLVAHGCAQIAARWLRVAPFRWFDGAVMAGAWWRRFAVRVASAMGPLVAVVAVLYFARLAAGTTVPTTRVAVLEGPAKVAGVRAGDRILSVDAKPVESWEEIRSEMRRSAREKRLEVERRGQKLTILVTPQRGVIGVRPIYEQQPVTKREALAAALAMPRFAAGAVSERALKDHEERTSLMGPVGIVQTTESQVGWAPLLFFLGSVGAFFWPLVAGVHVFDVLTLALFQATHDWAREHTVPGTVRLARVYQTLLASLMASAVFALLEVLQRTSFGDGALLGIWLLAPAALASVLLVGIAAHSRWGRARAAVTLAASLSIPCAVVGIAVGLAFWLRAELTRRGLRVRGLVSIPAEQHPAV